LAGLGTRLDRRLHFRDLTAQLEEALAADPDAETPVRACASAQSARPGLTVPGETAASAITQFPGVPGIMMTHA